MVNETLGENTENEVNSAEILTDMPSFSEHMAEITQENQETSADKEIENTVRKAESLKSLEELGLSDESCRRLMYTYKTIDGVVLNGRKRIFTNTYNCSALGSGVVLNGKKERRVFSLLETAPKCEKELASALENAGFIRPGSDFQMAFNLDRLYCYAYGTLLETKPLPIFGSGFFDRLSNEGYENFKGVPDDKIEEVKSALSSCDRLTERDYKIICWSFGLDGEVKSDEDITENLGLHDKNYTRELRRTALRKMNRMVKSGRCSLPPLGVAGF